ncbi:ATP-binding protein [Proteiniclasticum sp. QWL-01]|uniref:sensor histidine kinase n=1 Tax=Proteiniclasticum sp. QWL-01 TaxID=3036945 RepID=UPI00240F927A|nr:ATP-binding protein [Proteiniclasticum sp. QWL-01]WFF72266.1 ATP-binding protein [Proteiniclasticum sp. QWL-01]
MRFYTFIVLSLVIGVGGAFALTANIKESIFGLEPEEIALLLKEKEAILDHVKEGIITLDEHGHLIQHNQEAARILRLADQSAEGIIQSLRQDVRTESVHPGIDQELTLGDVSILYKYSVLKNARGKVLGQVINFRDTTEVREMAEELTGVKRMAWSLRAQNHEFLNKLHTIAGLIQLNEPEEALSYITATAHGNASFSSLITEKIKNVNIAALILAKYYKAEESRVSLALDPSSCLEEQPRGLRTDEMETVIGNLLENSLDAVATDGSGSISLLIRQEPDQLIIRVKNNGPAIPEAIREKIFEANFSTKAGQRGYGLHFIRRIIDRNQGKIRLVQTEDVTWDIKIPIKGDVVS